MMPNHFVSSVGKKRRLFIQLALPIFRSRNHFACECIFNHKQFVFNLLRNPCLLENVNFAEWRSKLSVLFHSIIIISLFPFTSLWNDLNAHTLFHEMTQLLFDLVGGSSVRHLVRCPCTSGVAVNTMSHLPFVRRYFHFNLYCLGLFGYSIRVEIRRKNGVDRAFSNPTENRTRYMAIVWMRTLQRERHKLNIICAN